LAGFPCMTNGDEPDGHVAEMSIRAAVVRLEGESTTTREEEQRCSTHS
jgi:hypothetical protein